MVGEVVLSVMAEWGVMELVLCFAVAYLFATSNNINGGLG